MKSNTSECGSGASRSHHCDGTGLELSGCIVRYFLGLSSNITWEGSGIGPTSWCQDPARSETNCIIRTCQWSWFRAGRWYSKRPEAVSEVRLHLFLHVRSSKWGTRPGHQKHYQNPIGSSNHLILPWWTGWNFFSWHCQEDTVKQQSSSLPTLPYELPQWYR